MTQRVLITGASRGFGKLTVKTLLRNKHNVVASMRNIAGKNREAAAELESLGAKIVEIDVTNEAGVNKGVKKAIDMLGGIDVVVNNAGIGVIGMQEHFTPEDLRKLFDINVFGIQRVNRAVLPHMRRNRSGLLIHISSLLGRMTLPFFGPYNATKWAVEALAENYRVELSGFGIDSCIIEPGGYSTNFMDNLMTPGDTSRDEEYGDFMDVPQIMMEGFKTAFSSNPEQNPQKVADAISRLIDIPAGERPLRTVVDFIGMGDYIKGYNSQLTKITKGVYNAFGLGEMLKQKV